MKLHGCKATSCILPSLHGALLNVLFCSGGGAFLPGAGCCLHPCTCRPVYRLAHAQRQGPALGREVIPLLLDMRMCPLSFPSRPTAENHCIRFYTVYISKWLRPLITLIGNIFLLQVIWDEMILPKAGDPMCVLSPPHTPP